MKVIKSASKSGPQTCPQTGAQAGPQIGAQAGLTLPLFALATASPLGLLVLAVLWGGVWVWAALVYMAGAVVALDLLVPRLAGEARLRGAGIGGARFGEAGLDGPAVGGTEVGGTEVEGDFPAADTLLVVLGLGALLVLPVLVWAVAGPSGLGLPARVAVFLAGGLWFGQVAHPAAHELIHRPGRGLFWLGVAVYAALLFGHHASAHRLVHHRFVASAGDPNSARAGEGYYRFLIRAWRGSLRAGWAAEAALRGGRRAWRGGWRKGWRGVNPFWVYGGGGGLALALGYGVAGWPGVLVWAGFGFHFGAQVLLSDYVQHYGLERHLAAGRLEPVAGAHSWNAPHVFSSAMMLNAPRHSDHHAHPGRPYPALRLADDMPLLPWPLPLACLVALWPPYWRRRMQPLVAAHKTAGLATDGQKAAGQTLAKA